MNEIRRQEVIARARGWAMQPRRYSQEDCDPESKYRLDCSGFVSMAWQLDVPGLTTVELPDLCRQIQNHELLPGDVVMLGGPGTSGSGGHAILFESWADAEQATFWAYEQVDAGTVHVVKMFPPSPPYLSYRYQRILE